MFARTYRLSNAIAAVESAYDRGVERLGKYIDKKEAQLRERKINRDAVKLLRETEYQIEVMRRAAELHQKVI